MSAAGSISEGHEVLDAYTYLFTSIFAIGLTIFHCTKVYSDLFTEDRNCLNHKRKKPPLSQKYKYLIYTTTVAIFGWTFVLFWGTITRNFWFRGGDCTPIWILTSISWFLAKSTMYFTFLMKLHDLYGPTRYRYHPNTLNCIAIFVVIASSVLLIFIIISYIEFEVIVDDEDTNFPHYCTLSSHNETWNYILGAGLLLYDLTLSIGSMIAFNKPLLKVKKLVFEDNEDTHYIKWLYLGYKYKVLVFCSSITTLSWISFAVCGFLDIASLIGTVDNLINIFCIMMMTPYYPDNVYYQSLCFLCKCCCDKFKKTLWRRRIEAESKEMQNTLNIDAVEALITTGRYNEDNTHYIDQEMARQLREEKQRSEQHNIKLLLLGPGKSGKSTFLKQLTRIYGSGFRDEEFNSAAKRIEQFVIDQMKHLLGVVLGDLDFPSELKNIALIVYNISDGSPLNVYADEIAQLWQHQTIKDAYINRTNSGICDSAGHFFDALDRIKSDEYRPTEDDMLLLYTRTTGWIEQEIYIEKAGYVHNAGFHIFDIGGMRQERKKWISCFDEVDGLIFVISLSCYNEMMYEDNSQNCMVDSLELFESTINSKYFTKTAIILFLNKMDLFTKKIQKYPITECPAFSDFDYNNPDEDETSYIQRMFHEQSAYTKTIYTHITSVTDRNNVRNVFNDVTQTVTDTKMAAVGLL